MRLENQNGWIEVITGPMYSGKSSELIKRLKTLLFAKKEIIAFNNILDDRWDNEKNISTRDGLKYKSNAISSILEIKKFVKENTYAVFVDEFQFFNKKDDLLYLKELANSGIRVVVAGLDMDHRMRPFGHTTHLIAIAEYVTKLKAVCFKCGGEAAFTKKIRGSQLKTIEVGSDTYEARCRQCFK